MEDERLERERESLRTIRGRWRLRGWHFNPLERLDGESEVIDSLYALDDSPVCWPSFERLLPHGNAPAQLIDALQELYRRAMLPWERYRTVFDSHDSQRDLMRWPFGTFPAKLRQDVFFRFWELKTTTRFSVSAATSVHALRRVNWPNNQITDRHLTSIAAMVCIVQAIESLESIVSSWAIASSKNRKGLPFQWMATHPIHIDWLEVILRQVLEDPSERAFFASQVARAQEERRQAESWLAHAETLELQDESVERAIKATEVKTLAKVSEARKTQAVKAASAPRAPITVDDVVAYFKAHPEKSRQEKFFDLAARHEVSESTIERRHKEAKKKNLLS